MQATLTSRQQRLMGRAVAAVISERTLAEAAAKAGISLSALRTWRTLPEFQTMLQAAQGDLVRASIQELARRNVPMA